MGRALRFVARKVLRRGPSNWPSAPLRNKELDRAIVGGVDLAGDPRSMTATDSQRPFSPTGNSKPLEITSEGVLPGEGAGAMVLKRLADAERDGDRIYAIIKGVGSASGGSATIIGPDSAAYASSMVRAYTDAMIDPMTVEYYEVAATGTPLDDRAEADALGALLKTKPRTTPLTLSSVRGQVGHAGAAGPMASLIKACVALYQQILPPTVNLTTLRTELASLAGQCFGAKDSRFWLRDNDDAPRRALVAATGVDGSVMHFVLEESTQTVDPVSIIDPTTDPERLQPLGARAEALFAVEGDSPADLIAKLSDFATWLSPQQTKPVEFLAREWLLVSPYGNTRRRAIAFVARSGSELLEQIRVATSGLRSRPDAPMPGTDSPETRPAIKDRIFYSPQPVTMVPGVGTKGRVAFVFPGSGNHFPTMGRDIGANWPEILRRQQAENRLLRGQYAPAVFWRDALPPTATAKDFLFGQVTLGTLTADLLSFLGIKPDAMIGQSLGESAGLFGLRVWRERDEMLTRIRQSTLFQSDLAPPYNAARAFWAMGEETPVDWISGVLAAPAEQVQDMLRPGLKAYLLIITTPTECVIGGVREDVETIVAKFPGKAFLPLPGVTLAHCEAGQPVEEAYRELHTLNTTPPTGLSIYSGAYGRPYKPTPAIAADSITAGLLNTIDFPACIQAAYRDGVRIFVEVGPGNSTTRMISAILAGKPHMARAVCVPRQDNVSMVLRAVAALIAERVPLDLSRLYGATNFVTGHQAPSGPSGPFVKVRVGMVSHEAPLPPWITPPPPPIPRPVAVPVIVEQLPPEPFFAEPEEEFSDLGFELPPMEPEVEVIPLVVQAPKEGLEPILSPTLKMSQLIAEMEADDETDFEPIDVDTPPPAKNPVADVSRRAECGMVGNDRTVCCSDLTNPNGHCRGPRGILERAGGDEPNHRRGRKCAKPHHLETFGFLG